MDASALRWQYWKQQQVAEFIADDGSGGKKNEKMRKWLVKPNIDQCAWNQGLGSADKRYGFDPAPLRTLCSWTYLTAGGTLCVLFAS